MYGVSNLIVETWNKTTKIKLSPRSPYLILNIKGIQILY
jgi:hypothetical protein